MSLRFLLDTNILSEPTRQNPHPNVMAMLEQHELEVATSTTVWQELLFGCSRLPDSQRRRFLERYLNQIVRPTIPILPYDVEAATWHGIERARLTSIGKTPSFPDGQIAAVAKVNNLIVVTNNVSDYRNFLDLAVENWFE
ncbi:MULTISPECIES: type II toxin-antitoxin system VapC family toxin [Arthrospira]|uniref:PIN domain-containing protein n=1 Tax=Limnospira platensis NIES-46 TaxID=1236695 RepID=A0A5M3TCJ0_LIMPL|nr:type II toxin-antitoxin system VapC family toxin [Arthrospira platensis]AMW30305.1 twitching motility protein PilT [Arthrospira platensis YZ]KDR58298.1 twitching motility protein PilT [Arthrospira platensis str. Paraca]MBD2669290.1 type II toxin-antitoxin system VapC family toxin [Arthrospira platensis FACHB-439]MBD2711593.1 type II toxin-antitoxin system VapC family toxin [Arthrospira platensis FACHB-835]MDF2207769.1 type II toxin-antitoxin system VapC family toxin [Arthrospira platensis N